ncbi:MAG: cell division protein FtsA [Candidatus Marinimicrobia bacterium]|nr:cell division protein FtsA [Candidatus Neomarinimicrobiota bacterium]|tara:strand:- start:12744 stop:13997 length:1254 start_codon:yes stop_codon:yes gene_type:complete
MNLITGIDIGTTKIAVIIAELKNDEINIIGFGESISNGLRRGVVVDIDKTANAIENALNKAEEQAEIEIESAWIGITGEHVKGINCSGTITISNNEFMNPAGEKITKESINKVLEHAEAINLSPQRKILHTLSREFKIDDNSNIKNPEGLSGHRLEANVHLVTIARNIESDLKTCLDRIGLDFNGFILEPLASASSVLDNDEKQLGVALIDIGGGTSDIIIYSNNSVIHTAAIPLGGMSITNDIAYGLTVNLDQAEQLKCKHGIAKEALSSDDKNIIIKGTNERPDIELSQKKLASIIEARMKEIFHLAKSEIRKVENEVKLNFGVVLTGGGSRLTNIDDLAQEVFELEVKIGKPNSINGIDDIINNPRYATTIGLIKYVANGPNNKRIHKNTNDTIHILNILKRNGYKLLKYLNLK